jgi:hypothetical protein
LVYRVRLPVQSLAHRQACDLEGPIRVHFTRPWPALPGIGQGKVQLLRAVLVQRTWVGRLIEGLVRVTDSVRKALDHTAQNHIHF